MIVIDLATVEEEEIMIEKLTTREVAMVEWTDHPGTVECDEKRS